MLVLDLSIVFGLFTAALTVMLAAKWQQENTAA